MDNVEKIKIKYQENVELRHKLDMLIKPFKISYTQYLLLETITTKQSDEMSDIAQLFKVSKPGVSRKIRTLETLGLIAKVHGGIKDDQRRVKLYATDKGTKVYFEITNVLNTWGGKECL